MRAAYTSGSRLLQVRQEETELRDREVDRGTVPPNISNRECESVRARPNLFY